MCGRITQGKATCLGENDGVGITHAGAFEVEYLTVERNVRPFRQEFGVENKSVVTHAAFVEDFGVEDKETSEFGTDFGKVDTPFYEIFIGRYDFIYIELVDATDEVGTADENFPVCSLRFR